MASRTAWNHSASPRGSSSAASAPRAAAGPSAPRQRWASACTRRALPRSSPSGAERHGALGVIEGRGEVVAGERLLGGALVVARGGGELSTELEVQGEERGVDLARALQVGARQPVAHAAVGVGEHGVGGLAHHRVAEGVLGLAGEDGGGAAGRHLHRHEPLERLGQRRGRLAEEGGHAASPEGLPEDAGRPQDALGLGPERVEARLHHAEHRVGHGLARACELGAHQLLDVERVALGPGHDALHGRWLGTLAEGGAHQALARPGGERAEADLLCAAVGEEPGEASRNLRPRQRHHQEGALVEGAQGSVDEAHARAVAPVKVLEDQDHRLRRALGVEPLDPRGPHQVEGEHGVARGRGGALARDAGELADPGDRRGRPPADAGAELGALAFGRLAVEDAREPADGRPEEAERRGLGQGAAAGEEDLGPGLGAREPRRGARRGSATCRCRPGL